MTVGYLPEPILVTRPIALKQIADDLRRQPVVAVDTESNSLYAYREQVCLIQFSVPGKDYLVDPLALKDMSALGPLFADPAVEKIFHAAEYDLICLKRDFDFEFANLFDTMVAARILGREEVGLGSLLDGEFGIAIDKRYQRANWGQRPLPEHLLTYARMDTHYLIALRNRLRNELNRRELFELAKEDFERMTKISGNGRAPSDADCYRVNGASELNPQQAAVLVELCKYRDKLAKRMNRPLFKIFNDRTLVEIAAQAPQDRDQLSQIQGMTPGQVERHAAPLLDAVTRGAKMKPVYPVHAPRPDEQFLARLEALRRWRKTTAQEMGVQSDVILPRDLLHALAEKNPANLAELDEALAGASWRRKRFGEQLLEALTPVSPPASSSQARKKR